MSEDELQKVELACSFRGYPLICSRDKKFSGADTSSTSCIRKELACILRVFEDIHGNLILATNFSAGRDWTTGIDIAKTRRREDAKAQRNPLHFFAPSRLCVFAIGLWAQPTLSDFAPSRLGCG